MTADNVERADDASSRNGRRVRFWVRALVVLVLLAVVGEYTGLRCRAVNSYRARREAPVIAAIEALGGKVTLTPDGRVHAVTDVGLAHLRELTNLQRLDLTGIRVTGPGLVFLQPMPDSRSLRLSAQDGDLALEHVGGLRHLHALHFNAHTLTNAGLAHLEGLTDLRSLSLFASGQPVEGRARGLRYLSKMTRLQTLELKLVVSDIGLEGVRGLTELKTLDLEFGRHVTDAGLEHLKELTSLEKLQLYHLVIGDPSGITDAGLQHLTGLTGLKKLSIIGTNVTAEGIAELKRVLPDLTVYWED